MTEKQKKWIAGGGIALFLLLSGLVFWFAGKPMVRFVSEPEQFRLWVEERGWWGRLAFVGMVLLQVLVAVIPGEPLEIAAGYAFGFLEGTLLCLVGMTIGGALVFGFVRRFGVRALEVFFSREKIENIKFLQNNRRVYLIVIAAFLLPGRLIIRLPLRMPAALRLRQPLGVMRMLSARMASGMPGVGRSMISMAASGVMSRGEKPVPPVVSTRAMPSSSEHLTSSFRIISRSSGSMEV